MKTIIYQANELDKEEVQKNIKNAFVSGENVVFPTETVYGIGANALDENGINGIYRVKGRPSDNPLIMHLSSVEDLPRYTKNHQPYIKQLIDAFWPGPLTMVFEKTSEVLPLITGGLNTVGIRIPSSDVARKVIDIAGVPVCAPSANISGRPSATLFEHVVEDFNGKVSIMIDGGQSTVGLESTVLDVTNQVPIILRPGMITASMIKEIVGDVDVAQTTTSDNQPISPGMKYKHYAPKGELIVIDGPKENMVTYINQQIKTQTSLGHTVAVITTNDLVQKFKTTNVFSVGSIEQDEEIAANLFLLLRKMDVLGIDIIYSVTLHGGRHEEAIMNRLLKAASHKIIKV